MSVPCKICSNRNHDLAASECPSPATLTVTLAVLRFTREVHRDTVLYNSLQDTMRSIAESPDSPSYLTRFTSWSPAIDDPSIALILTTAVGDQLESTSPMFSHVVNYLAAKPSILRMELKSSIVKTAATEDPKRRIPVDILILRAPNNKVARAIGKTFGWSPLESALSKIKEWRGAHFRGLELSQDRGDLLEDFCSWTDCKSRNGEETNRALRLADADVGEKLQDKHQGVVDEEAMETFFMMFHWASRSDGERFKDPESQSIGHNGSKMGNSEWYREIVDPVEKMQNLGARVEKFRAELRGVEPWVDKTESEKGRRRLSSILGAKVSALWR